MSHHVGRTPIAVIGLACWFPDARNPRQLWENVLGKRRAFRRTPDCRLPLEDYYSPDRGNPDTTYGSRSAVIDGFDFDWAARRIPHSTLQSTDIVHWLALEMALTAIKDAGYAPDKIPGEGTGVIIGNTLTGEQTRSATLRLRWPFVKRILNAAATACDLSPDQRHALETAMVVRYKAVFPPVTEDTLAGGLANTIAGRICNYLNLFGGGYTVDGACSSSLLATATAVERLVHGDLDLVLAGGVDISLDPFELVGFAKTGALSPGDMKVYDKHGTGFIPGEGCGFVILKRLDQARKDGNRIYAQIHGWGISSDGRGSGVTAPSVPGQVRAIRQALVRSPFQAGQLDFIEGHGTATALGDRTELQAIDAVLKKDTQTGPRSCGVTSLKSIIGHTKAASGIGGLIKAIMAVNRRVIPPTAGCTEPHPFFQEKTHTIYPVLHGVQRDPGTMMNAGVSSMGFGGINCHITLTSADPPDPGLAPELDEASLLVSAQHTELFILTGDSRQTLAALAEGIAKEAAGISLAETTDLAAHMAGHISTGDKWRAGLVADTPENLSQRLEALASYLRKTSADQRSLDPSIQIGGLKQTPRLGLLFPGQGSQQLNMARTIVQRFEWAHDLVAMAESCTGPIDGMSLGRWIYRDSERARDTNQAIAWAKALSRTEIAQPAICLASVLWLKLLERLGLGPAAVGGHSLGEVTAFYAAGAIDLNTLMEFAALRSREMSRAGVHKGAMAALFCNRDKAKELVSRIEGYLTVANYNSPRQTVISGVAVAVEKALQLAAGKKIRARRLAVSGAFHSELMHQAAHIIVHSKLLPEKIEKLNCRLFSAMDGRELFVGDAVAAHMGDQITSPVKFSALVRSLANETDLMFESGPGDVLSGLVQDNPETTDKACWPLEARAQKDQDLNHALAAAFVHGANIRWQILYNRRLVRPYVSPVNRKFIVNHCEQPLPEELMPTAGKEKMPSPSVSDQAVAAPAGGLKVQFLELIRQRTGFAPDTISLHYRLLDDLNLDSIKAGDLLVRLANQAGVRWPDDPAVMANATLEEILAAVGRLQAQNSTGQTPLSQPAPESDSAAGAQSCGVLPGPAWVRNFSLQQIRADLTAQADNKPWEKVRAYLIFDPAAEVFAQTLTVRLQEKRAGVDPVPLDKTVSPDHQPAEDVTHCIIMMPPEKVPLAETASLLPLMVRLRAAVSGLRLDHLTGLVFVQYGGGHFGRSLETANLNGTACTALAAGLHHEHPLLQVRVVDLPAGMAAAEAAACVIAEMETPEPYCAAGYDINSHRWLLQPRISVPATYQPRSLNWSKEDVIVVSGGAKGITAECAIAAAQAAGAQLALLGSMPLPATGKESRRDIEQNMARMAAAGIKARYYACDITRAEEVAAIVRQIRETQGPIRAVVHGAGLNRPKPVQTVSVQDALIEISPKVSGLLNLWSALKNDPPWLVVGLSSIIGVTGMPGNAWYGFANEALDILLQAIEAESGHTRTQSVAFSIWGQTGMGARMGSVTRLEQMGIAAIPTEQGRRRFGELFTADPGAGTIIVTARLGGLDTWNVGPGTEAVTGRFCRRPISLTPGVEAVFQAHLDLAHDQYLMDHEYQGSFLFPTVFGLEAMTQAAAAATGLKSWRQIEFTDIQLKRPITVDAENGADIVVWAQVEEPESLGDPVRVRAGIRKSGTGAREDHFSAAIVFDPALMVPDFNGTTLPAAMAIEPLGDLYRETLLFQGPRFQRIEQVYALDGNSRDQGKALLGVSCLAQSEASARAFEPAQDQLVLPDPFFSDALLQSAALLVPQDPCLPVAIDRLTLYAPPRGKGFFTVQVDLQGCQEQTFVTRVQAVDGDNKVVMRLEGYGLKILKHVETYPTVDELKAPVHRDRRLAHTRLSQAAGHFQCDLPELLLDYMPGIHQLPRQERRALEQPLFRQVLDQACRRHGVTGKGVITWDEAGKPLVTGDCADRMGVSLSHDERLCVVAAGPAPQGCDMAPVTTRSPEQWSGLLGPILGDLMKSLLHDGDSLDQAGTRLWAALEAVRKASGTAQVRLQPVGRHDHSVLFTASAAGQELHVLTVVLHLTWGPPRILAVVVKEGRRIQQTPLHYPPHFAGLCQKPAYEVLPSGPQGELVFVQRFPVTFKPGAQLSRNVYFTNYFDWMGHAREASTYPIMRELIDLLSTGRWGSVTNYSKLEIFGEARTGDLIELRMWTSKNDGPQNGTMTLQYDFTHLQPDGHHHRLAFSELQTTWVELVGHGQARPAPYPPVLQDFFNDMIPRGPSPQPNTALPAPLASWHGANDQDLYYQAPAGPVIKPQLAAKNFETSQGQSNAVGNVYYAKYYEWQGVLRDTYLQALIPDYFGNTGEKGEALCLACGVDHLREAMPFDTIMVTMALKTLYKSRATLCFEYYRADPGKAPVKLAYGSQDLVWVVRDASGKPAPAAFPPQVGHAFETAVGRQNTQLVGPVLPMVRKQASAG